MDTLETRLTPESEVVRLSVPVGSERLFELFALRRLDDPDLVELPVFFGEVRQDLVAGSNEVSLPYRAQGAIRISLETVGDTVVPDANSVGLVDEAGNGIEIPLNRTTVVPEGYYRLAESNTFLDPLRVTADLRFDVGTGEVVAETVSLFDNQTQCLSIAPPEVRQDGEGCTDFVFDIEGLAVESLVIAVNAVEVELDASGTPLDGEAAPGFPAGSAYTIRVASAGDNPRQECTVANGEGIGSGEEVTINIDCGPLLFPVLAEVLGTPPPGLEIDLLAPNGEDVLETFAVNGGGIIDTGRILEDGDELDGISFSARSPNDTGGVRCSAVEGVRLVEEGPALPARIFCLAQATPAYANSADLGKYVLNDGPDVLSATGMPCNEEATGFDACIHAGLMRSFIVPGYASCEGLSIGDSLSALEWECLAVDGVVTAYSRHPLALENAFRFQLRIDAPNLPVQLSFAPTVTDDRDGISFSGPPAVGWGNPLVRGNGLTSLSSRGRVYLFESENIDVTRFIEADEITLLVARGSRLSSARIEIDDSAYVTIGGSFSTEVGSGNIVRSFFSGTRFTSVSGSFDGTGELIAGVTNVAVQLLEQSTLRNAVISDFRSGVEVDGDYVSIAKVDFSDTQTAIESHSRLRVSNADFGGGEFESSCSFRRSDIWLDSIRSTGSLDLCFSDYVRITDSVFSNGDRALTLGGTSTRNFLRHVTFENQDSCFLEARFAETTHFNGLLVDECTYEVNSSRDLIFHDSAFFGGPGLIQVAGDSNNVRAEGALILTDSEGPCSVEDSVTEVGFTDGACVDASGELPPPSTAQVTLLPSGTPSGLITDPRGQRVLSADSPAAGSSPDVSRLSAFVMTWAEIPSNGSCKELVHDSVANEVLGTCENVFLEHAREIEGDGDGFCESDETCRYLPDPGGGQRGVLEFETMVVDAERNDGSSVPGLSGIRLQVPTAFR
ncbi:MAG: hypothetical protein AAFP04_03960 [Myxococcota bacterium]